MTEVKSIKRHLEKFGLNKNQAEIYILLIRQGNLRVSEIVTLTNMPRSSIYDTLRGLKTLGLVEEIIENSFKVIRAYPIGTIKHRLDEEILGLNKRSEELNYLEKSIEVLPSLKVPRTVTVRYYHGQAGARQLFWNTLKTKDTIYVHSEWGRGRYLGIEFYKKFVAESYSRGFSEKVITNSKPSVLDSIREHIHSPVSRTELDNIRCLDKSIINFRGDTLMYDNIYAHVFLKHEDISGFEIESKQFVETQRAMFLTLWEQAVPVAKVLELNSS